MDRDRDRRVRDRDIPPEDRYGSGRGQSYRPGNVRERTPPRNDSYRARSPTSRRPDYGEPYKSDSYRGPRAGSRSPPRREDFRRRSPSPPRYRGRDSRPGDAYGGRPRSPPPMQRREDAPRDQRDYGNKDRGYNSGPRSPPRFRERSPLPLKRGREPSPISSRGRRTPPPATRERIPSPRPVRYDDGPPSQQGTLPRQRQTPDIRGHNSPARGPPSASYLRSRSPSRADRMDTKSVEGLRQPRSPAPGVRAELHGDDSGRNSAATSRRSSPPIHPSRIAIHQHNVEPSAPAVQTPIRDSSDNRGATPTTIVPLRDDSQFKDASDSITRASVGTNFETPPEDGESAPRAPQAEPVSNRGPSNFAAPPTGPAASATPVHRPAATPPSGPRGAAPTPRGDFSGRGRGAYGGEYPPRGRGGFGGPFRGGRGAGAPGGGGQGRGEAYHPDSDFAPRGGGPPAGPRSSSFSQAPTAPFRPTTTNTGSSSASSPAAGAAVTYSRSQRFAPNGDAATVMEGAGGRRPSEAFAAATPRPHPALADLPRPANGGAKAEPLVDRTKLHKLEDEAERLRRQMDERDARKRRSLRDWDRLARESDAAALRSHLAEQALRQLSGEAESQAAF